MQESIAAQPAPTGEDRPPINERIATSEKARVVKELPSDPAQAGLAEAQLFVRFGISRAMDELVTAQPEMSLATVRTLARLSALLKHSREPLLLAMLLQDFFPKEIGNLIGAGKPTPEGVQTAVRKYSTRLSGLDALSGDSDIIVQYPELDRALVGVISTIQLVMGDWDLLRECQQALPPFLRLSDESCAEMQRFIFKAIDRDLDTFAGLLAVGLILDIDLKYVLSNDAGKMQSVAQYLHEKVKVEGGEAVVDTVDHDRILHLALTHCPELFPSFASLPKELQSRWLEALEVKLNPAQLNQGENLPVSIDPKLFEISPQALRLKCVETLGDLLGAKGHEVQNGTMSMIEPVCRGAMLTLTVLLEAHDEGLDPGPSHSSALREKQKEVYDTVLKRKNALYDWGLDIENTTDWVLARLCALGRIENREQADAIRGVFDVLSENTRETLLSEMGNTGLQKLGTWLEYLPGTLANAIRYYEKTKGQEKLDAIHSAYMQVLPACAKVFAEAAKLHTSARLSMPGEYVISIESLAKLALTSPEDLTRSRYDFLMKGDGAELVLQ